MYKTFTPVRAPAGTVPRVKRGKYKTGEAILNGTVLQHDANGELIIAAADPLDIVGVAAQPAGTGPGFGMADSPAVVTGRDQEISYWDANEQQEWVGRAENAGVLTAPLQTNIGESYGLINNGGEWRIDLTETTNKRVYITDVDLKEGLWYFKFAALALPIT